MSTASNPSSIMIYKIIRDFENAGRTTHSMSELYCFSKQVINFANSISEEDFWIVQTPEIKEDLLRICDISNAFCRLNEQKYTNGGHKFAKTIIGQMPYPWLKGSVIILKAYKEEKLKFPENTSESSIHYSNENTQPSSKNTPIVIEEKEN